MKAIWNDAVLAESNETVIVDNNHYFPMSSLNKSHFTESDKTTVCSWKGKANYFTIAVDGEVNKDAAWYYATPKEKAANIENHVAFWRGVNVVE